MLSPVLFYVFINVTIDILFGYLYYTQILNGIPADFREIVQGAQIERPHENLE